MPGLRLGDSTRNSLSLEADDASEVQVLEKPAAHGSHAELDSEGQGETNGPARSTECSQHFLALLGLPESPCRSFVATHLLQVSVLEELTDR